MTHFNIKHETTYFYDNDVFDVKTMIKTYPVEDNQQKVFSHFLAISTNPVIKINKDDFGNKYGFFYIKGPIRELNMTSTFDIETFERDVLNRAKLSRNSWEDVKLLSMDCSCQIFLHNKTEMEIFELRNVIQNMNIFSKTPLDVVLEMNNYVYYTFKYILGITSIFTTLLEVWNMKAGVCQDFSHMLIKMLRSIHIPARYVSGYICPNNSGMVGNGASHAWVEAYLPNYGWLGVDPTNNCVTEEKHVRVAYGRNYDDVSPIRGEFNGMANQSMLVKVTVGYYLSSLLLYLLLVVKSNGCAER